MGSKTPSEFLEWLDGLERGERSIELYVQRPTTAELASEVDGVPARMLVVRTLTRSGLFTQAADECIQAWNVMRNWEPTMTGARTAPVAREAKELVAQSSAARQKFVALRDSMGERLDGDKVVAHDLINWIALNRVLNDNAAGHLRLFCRRIGDKPGLVFPFGGLRSSRLAGDIDPRNLGGGAGAAAHGFQKSFSDERQGPL